MSGSTFLDQAVNTPFRMLDLVGKLGRVSSGLSVEPKYKSPEEDAALMIQIDVALFKDLRAGSACQRPMLWMSRR